MHNIPLIIKDYGNLDSTAAHVYEHMFLNRHRRLLTERGYPLGIVGDFKGITFAKDLMAIDGYLSEDAYKAYMHNARLAEEYTDEDLDRSVAEVACEGLRTYSFDRTRLWQAVDTLAKSPWTPYESYDYKDFRAGPETKPVTLLHYRTSHTSFKEVTINLELQAEDYGKQGENLALLMHFAMIITMTVTQRLPGPFYPLHNIVAKRKRRSLYSNVVARFPVAADIAAIKAGVIQALADIKNPRNFAYLRAEISCFAADPLLARWFGIERYFQENDILLGGKGLKRLLTPQRLAYIIDNLKVSYRTVHL
jgi:hypothetical protein